MSIAIKYPLLCMKHLCVCGKVCGSEAHFCCAVMQFQSFAVRCFNLWCNGIFC